MAEKAKMTKKQFLKEVDGVLAGMNLESATAFARKQAEVCVPADRDKFLRMLQDTAAEGNESPAQREEIAAARKKVILEKLEKIEKEEIWLDSKLKEPKYNDEWGYWEDDIKTYKYTDKNGVVKAVEEAAAYVHDCVEQKAYADACEVGRVLVSLEITVKGDYEEYEEVGLSLDDLKDEDLSRVSYKKTAREVLYAAYMDSAPDNRADVLFSIVGTCYVFFGGMKKFLKEWPDLPDRDSFPEAWLECLCRADEVPGEGYLEEAVELVQRPAFLLDMARKYYGKYPWLYEDYLERFGNKEENAYEAGLEAMEKIAPGLKVRSRIALMTARLAQKRGEFKQAEMCWLEAFRSDPNIVNWLRLFMESRDFSLYKEETENIIAALSARNTVPDENLLMLSFYEGDIGGLKEKGVDEEALGTAWKNSDFTEDTMAAFMLLLLRGNKIGQSCDGMMWRLWGYMGRFSAEAYNAGLAKQWKLNSGEMFWECFLKWRKTVRLTEEERSEYLTWLNDLVDRRAEKIVGGKKQDWYRKCAEEIAALGEVKESLGEEGARQRLLKEYSRKYPRHSSFQRELKEVGME